MRAAAADSGPEADHGEHLERVVHQLAVIGSAACATKGFVRTSVGELDDKVTSVSSLVEQTLGFVAEPELQSHVARIGRRVASSLNGPILLS